MKHHQFLLALKHPCPSPQPATSSAFSPSYTASQNSLCPEQLSIRHQLADLPNSVHLPVFRRARWLMNIQTLIKLGRPPMASLNAPVSTAAVTWGVDAHTENSGLCPEGHMEYRRYPHCTPRLHLGCQEESQSSCGGPSSIDESFAPKPSCREACGVQLQLQRTTGSSERAPQACSCRTRRLALPWGADAPELKLQCFHFL